MNMTMDGIFLTGDAGEKERREERMAQRENEVKLLGSWASPFVIRVRIALGIKRIKHEYSHETPWNKSELLLKSNPIYKKMPVLVHGGQPLCESLIILQYVEDTWKDMGPSILPAEPFDVAMCRFWASYTDDKLLSCFWQILGCGEREKQKIAAEQLQEVLKPLEETLAKKKKSFFNGDTVGYLDIALGCFVGWFKAFEKMVDVKVFDETNLPHLAAWAVKFSEVDAVKEVMPEADNLVEYSKKLLCWLSGSDPQD